MIYKTLVAQRTVTTVTESVLDLQTNQKTLSCEVCLFRTLWGLIELTGLLSQITCEDPLSEDVWSSFLGDCDAVTSVALRPSSRAVEGLRASFLQEEQSERIPA